MDDENPFNSAQSSSPTKKTYTTKYGAVAGGLAGFLLGAIGIGLLFLLFPGIPGVLQTLILLVGIIALFILPGAALGAFTVKVLNSQAEDDDQ